MQAGFGVVGVTVGEGVGLASEGNWEGRFAGGDGRVVGTVGLPSPLHPRSR